MRPLRLALCAAISVLALSALRTGVALTYGGGEEPPPAPPRSLQAAPSPPLIHPTSTAESGELAAPSPTSSRAGVLDGSVEAALRRAVPDGGGNLVVLTFGDARVRGVLLNFVAHARSSGTPHVIGAVDAGTFDQLSQLGAAVYKTPLALEASFQMDGRNDHSSSSWKRFAAMRTGEVSRIVSLGYDVLHSDVDVVWLRSPLSYLRCSSEDLVRSELRGEWASHYVKFTSRLSSCLESWTTTVSRRISRPPLRKALTCHIEPPFAMYRLPEEPRLARSSWRAPSAAPLSALLMSLSPLTTCPQVRHLELRPLFHP